MADDSLHCSVITPEAKVFEDDVTGVVVPAHDGEIGILHDRAPLLCKLGAGRLRVTRPSEELSFFVDGGFAQVLDNRVIILTQRAIPVGEIDRGEASRLLDEAQRMKPTDEIALRRKTAMENAARAMLRLAR